MKTVAFQFDFYCKILLYYMFTIPHYPFLHILLYPLNEWIEHNTTCFHCNTHFLLPILRIYKTIALFNISSTWCTTIYAASIVSYQCETHKTITILMCVYLLTWSIHQWITANEVILSIHLYRYVLVSFVVVVHFPFFILLPFKTSCRRQINNIINVVDTLRLDNKKPNRNCENFSSLCKNKHQPQQNKRRTKKLNQSKAYYIQQYCFKI